MTIFPSSSIIFPLPHLLVWFVLALDRKCMFCMFTAIQQYLRTRRASTAIIIRRQQPHPHWRHMLLLLAVNNTMQQVSPHHFFQVIYIYCSPDVWGRTCKVLWFCFACKRVLVGNDASCAFQSEQEGWAVWLSASYTTISQFYKSIKWEFQCDCLVLCMRWPVLVPILLEDMVKACPHPISRLRFELNICISVARFQAHGELRWPRFQQYKQQQCASVECQQLCLSHLLGKSLCPLSTITPHELCGVHSPCGLQLRLNRDQLHSEQQQSTRHARCYEWTSQCRQPFHPQGAIPLLNAVVGMFDTSLGFFYYYFLCFLFFSPGIMLTHVLNATCALF